MRVSNNYSAAADLRRLLVDLAPVFAAEVERRVVLAPVDFVDDDLELAVLPPPRRDLEAGDASVASEESDWSAKEPIAATASD